MKKISGYIISFLLVISVFCVYLAIVLSNQAKWNGLGEFGDSFGALTSLFTGLAFAGLVATLLLQKEDLEETRNEFKLQNKTFERQRFEDSFYRLLALYKDNLRELSIDGKDGGRIEGIDALRTMLEKFQLAWVVCSQQSFPETKVERDAYLYLLLTCVRSKLSKHRRYLETISTILNFIYEECPEISDKARYCKILASQLTIYEVKYLFYQALDSQVDTELRKLMLQSDVIVRKISESNISKGHLKAFEHLWDLNIPHKGVYKFPMSQKDKIKARKFVKKQGLAPTVLQLIKNEPTNKT